VVDAPLSDILNQLPLAINVHVSQAKINNYVACGNITTNGTSTTTASAGLPSTGGPIEGQIVTVQYTNSGFTPAVITIKQGYTVQFVNASDGEMWVASNPHPTHTDYPAFDEKKSVSKGGVYEFTFDRAGTWGYHNHDSFLMAGTVVVK
jgi:plastocyanin